MLWKSMLKIINIYLGDYFDENSEVAQVDSHWDLKYMYTQTVGISSRTPPLLVGNNNEIATLWENLFVALN